MRAEDSASPPQKKIKGRARDRETPWSPRSPANGHQRSVTQSWRVTVWTDALEIYLKLLVRSFCEFTGQRVESLPHRPVHRENMSQLAQRRVQLREGEKKKKKNINSNLCMTAMQILRSCISHQLTAREFLASFSTCLAAWISSTSPTPRSTHTCCWTRTHRRSITLETDRRGSVTSARSKHRLTNAREKKVRAAAQASATCSAVLVTRPWCSRRACLWEKRWVWLFLTRARWICVQQRGTRDVVNISRA